jgi:cytochrome P450
MTIYPEVQKKAQVAIDEVVGLGRLPDFEDDIPYMDAVVREVLRWRPVTPISMRLVCSFKFRFSDLCF